MGRFSAMRSRTTFRAMFLIFVSAIALVSVPGVTTPLYAQNGTWISTTSGLWRDAANWSGREVAYGLGYTADFSKIDITSDTTVHLDSWHIIGNLIFGDTTISSAGNWVLDNNGNPSNSLLLDWSFGGTPTITVNQLGVGKTATIGLQITGMSGLTKAGVGTLVLSGANTYTGLTTVSAGVLAYGADNVIANASVTVSGGTLSLGSYSDSVGAVTLTAGAISGGTLTSWSGFTASEGSISTVLAGTVALTKTGSGTVTLSGANTFSGLTTVTGGVLAYGADNVIADGRVEVYGGTISMGSYSDSVGRISVGGGGRITCSGSLTSTGVLNIGLTGGGTVEISSGGSLRNSSTAYVEDGGVVNISGVGSTWTSDDYLFVGEFGQGALNITNGGKVNSPTSYIGGDSTGSSGTVTVDGAGSTWTSSGQLYVGFNGSGTLKVTKGGSISTSATCLGDNRGSSGTVTVDGNGSTWTNSGSLIVGQEGSGPPPPPPASE